MNSASKQSLKFKFLLVLILSNATVFLLCLSSPEESKSKSSSIRENYVPLKIYGHLRTVLNDSYPVQIVAGNQIFKNIFILKKYESSKTLIEEPLQRQEFLIHIHQDAANLVKANSTYDILPLSLNITKKTQKRLYEISF